MADNLSDDKDQLDAFFDAADSSSAIGMRNAAARISRDFVPAEEGVVEEVREGAAPVVVEEAEGRGKKKKKKTRAAAVPEEAGEDLDGKYIAIDPDEIPGVRGEDPFVLVPANIHAYVPWWGWVTIACGLVVFIAAVILMPGVSLSRLASRLGDKNEAVVQKTMRQLVVNGDERTVRKLYDMASSPEEGLTTRLRAVDTMSLIERVPEVDRALLRLELSGGTHDRVREAAIAARKQREAYQTRQNR